MNIRFLFLLPCLLILPSCVGMGMQEPAPFTVHAVSENYVSAGTYAMAYTTPDVKPASVRASEKSTLYKTDKYKVQPGDTLYKLSRRSGVSVTQIAQANNIAPTYGLKAGQVIRVPGSGAKAQEGVRLSSVSPAVKPGQKEIKTVQNQKSILLERVPARSSGKFMRPVEGRLIAAYGGKTNGLQNDGINIMAPRGTPVRAAENGVVVYAGNAVKGSGHMVLIRHQDKWMTAYAHLDQTYAHKGQTVRRGDTIGTVGSTGSVSEPQLHFEIRKGTEALNPVKYL